jgi:hypothetical protein
MGLLLLAAPALAEPYFAVREGLRCSACHTNMNGGGKRTDLVSTHARDLLHYPNFFGQFSNPPDFFNGEINKYFAVGADLRASNTAIFQNLERNGEVSNNKAFRGRLERDSLDVTEAVAYFELRLLPDYLTVYVDQRFQPSTDNREAFALLHGVLPWNGYVKAGRMFLPYGLQLQDDAAFIRGGQNGSANSGFSFNQQEGAFEVGFEPGPFTLVAAVSEGPSGDRDLRVTTTESVLFTDLPVVRTVFVGNSFSRVGPPGTETVLFGFFAGTNIERLTVLGEGDFRSDRTSVTQGRSVGRFLGYGEADYLFFDWLNFKATVDYADDDGTLVDPNTNQLALADDSENRVSIGLEPFLNRFVQPRIFYRVSNGVRTQATHNQDVLLAEVHVFF